ncbi:hypothetical protein Pfo_008290 [Paulownia fortunei]|nr:hypothetical protein Pfo_008290 [Paulownia fortunei]
MGKSHHFNPCSKHDITRVLDIEAMFINDLPASIGSLVNLEFLLVKTRGPLWEKHGTRDDEFQQLRFLKLADLNLVQWNVASSEHFPKLQRLVLHHCYNQQEIPREMGEIVTLQSIEVERCQKSVAESAIQIEQEQRDTGNEEFRVISRIFLIHDTSNRIYLISQSPQLRLTTNGLTLYNPHLVFVLLEGTLFRMEGEKRNCTWRLEQQDGWHTGTLDVSTRIHCDVKPENNPLPPKIASENLGFGPSELLNREQSCFLTTLKGTWGYVAPEWLANTAIYSYGWYHSSGRISPKQ